MTIKDDKGKWTYFVEVDRDTYYHIIELREKLDDYFYGTKDFLANPISENVLEDYYCEEIKEAEKKTIDASDYYEDMKIDMAQRQNALARESRGF